MASAQASGRKMVEYLRNDSGQCNWDRETGRGVIGLRSQRSLGLNPKGRG